MNPTGLNPIEQIDRTFLFIIGVSVVMLIGITCFMLYCLWAYNYRRHPEPSQVDSNVPLEVAWTVIPTILVIAMFWFGWSGFKGMRTVPSDAFPIKVTGRMWAWQFEYPNGKRHDELWVPLGRPVKVTITSDDVLHSFYIPGFRLKMDAVPGMETVTWFRPDHLGSYTIYCAEYCGLKHADMISQVQVFPVQEFETWYGTRDEKASALNEGKKLLHMNGCLGCHSLDGAVMAGPTFKGLFGKQTLVLRDGREQEVTENEEHVRSSICDPALDIVKGYEAVMPKVKNLKDDEVRLMIEFIKTVK